MAGYGQKFSIWCQSEDRKPYYSLGNGCLMRIMLKKYIIFLF